MKDHYFNLEHQKECELGYLDGLHGICHSGHSAHRQKYLSGNQDGLKERAKKIYDARVENIKKVREGKNALS